MCIIFSKLWTETMTTDAARMGLSNTEFDTARAYYESLFEVDANDAEYKFPAPHRDFILINGYTLNKNGKSEMDADRMSMVVEKVHRALREGVDMNIYVRGTPGVDNTKVLDEEHAKGSGNLAYKHGQWGEGLTAPLMKFTIRWFKTEDGSLDRVFLIDGCKFIFSNFYACEGFNVQGRIGNFEIQISSGEGIIQTLTKCRAAKKYPLPDDKIAGNIKTLKEFLGKVERTDIAVDDIKTSGHLTDVIIDLMRTYRHNNVHVKALGQILPLSEAYFADAKGPQCNVDKLMSITHDKSLTAEDISKMGGYNAASQMLAYAENMRASKSFRDLIALMHTCNVTVVESAAYKRENKRVTPAQRFYYVDTSFGDQRLPCTEGPSGNIFTTDTPEVYKVGAWNAMGLGLEMAKRIADKDGFFSRALALYEEMTEF